ncbi:DUF4270 domain-containing protein [Psychroflexus aestuariivivens]|uniref:DUF4270 domain-containing protein n=1 Tax=Psychroflexus aestuariivivens TaxID=1795040 RepID=UPI000FDB786E|nr:DUF4270 domain-containing protein [Psychroflexus aestuariivivens]
MKKKINSMLKSTLRLIPFFLIIATIISCEDEFAETGSDFVNSIEIQPAYEMENLAAYSEKINSVQSNGYNNYFLGKYNDPIYGTSEASILTQLILSESNPDFGTDPVIDSVVLTLPFYSRQIAENEYVLDSVYGDGSFKLNIYESNQFLRNFDPGENGEFEEAQIYYSDQLSEFQSNIENTPLATSEDITPSEMTESIVLFNQLSEENIDTVSVSPRIRVNLPVEYFNEKIFDESNQEFLVSNNSFINYLRGFYLEAEQESANSEDVMAMFNMNAEDADITIYYRTMRPEPSTEIVVEPELEERFETYELSFIGNKVNLYENNFSVDLSDQNQVDGEENIYLRGGEGSVGVIELFNGPDSDDDGVSDELEELRNNNWLVNEANLDFYVNESIASSNTNLIDRILIYDLDNETVLVDYQRDQTTSENPLTSRTIHLGRLREKDNGDKFYRIRLTNHINNIINNNEDNVRLGLVVVDNVNAPQLVDVRDSNLDILNSTISKSFTMPKGTVLYGNQAEDESKRLKLRIIYTETETN